MSKEIVISKDRQQTRIAIVEEGKLVELFVESDQYERTIGNLFLGRVRRIMPSIKAAFVDIGQKQDAFLHFSDLADGLPDWLAFVQEDVPTIRDFRPRHVQASKGRKRRKLPRRAPRRGPDGDVVEGEDEDEIEAFEERRDSGQHHGVADAKTRSRRRSAQRRRGRSKREEVKKDATQKDSGEDDAPLESFLKRDQPILVKISKEPISAKGSRITTDISLAGRFVVLVPMANYVAVSKKIASFKERRRLRALARMLLPDGFGVIVRTVAEGQTAKALDTDLRLLLDRWEKIEQRLAEKPQPPAPVFQDVNMVSSIIRDLFSDDYDRILIDDQRLYRNIRGYIQAVAPEMAPDVQLHEGRGSVFALARVDRQIAEAFESRVNLPSGGYLFIEQTEAMHVVDVNSGRAGKGLSQDDNSLKVNLEAAQVIAKQIRLRDLGGIIVIDFIDMRSERARRKVYEALRREFRRDRAVTKVLPMSDFGLMEITRQRLRPSITTTFSGEEVSGLTTADLARPEVRVTPEEVKTTLDEWMASFRKAGRTKPVRLVLHPFTRSYLNRGFIKQSTRWFWKYRVRVRVEEDATVFPTTFRFLDAETGKPIAEPPPPLVKPEPAKKAEEGRASRAPEKESDRSQQGDSKRSGDGRSSSGRGGRRGPSRGRGGASGGRSSGSGRRGSSGGGRGDSTGGRRGGSGGGRGGTASGSSSSSSSSSSSGNASGRSSGGGRGGSSRGGSGRSSASGGESRGSGGTRGGAKGGQAGGGSKSGSGDTEGGTTGRGSGGRSSRRSGGRSSAGGAAGGARGSGRSRTESPDGNQNKDESKTRESGGESRGEKDGGPPRRRRGSRGGRGRRRSSDGNASGSASSGENGGNKSGGDEGSSPQSSRPTGGRRGSSRPRGDEGDRNEGGSGDREA